MAKLILYPLLILLVVGVLSQLMMNFSPTFTGVTNSTIDQSGSEFTTDGTTTTVQTGKYIGTFTITQTSGITALIIGLVALGIIAGIRVVDTGLSDYSVQIIHKCTLYYGLWGVFSSIAIGSILIIPLFGSLVWFILTLIYSLGVFQSLGGNSA